LCFASHSSQPSSYSKATEVWGNDERDEQLALSDRRVFLLAKRESAKHYPAPFRRGGCRAARDRIAVVMRRSRAEVNRTPRTRVHEDLRRRCLARASAAREQLRAQHRSIGSSGEERHADVSIISAIVAEELRRTPHRDGPSEARPSAWSEADEAALQAALGKEAYLELMAATEETLLREYENGADDDHHHADHWSSDAAREYEMYVAAQAEEHDATGDEAGAVLCPLCVRSTLTLSGDGHVTCRGGLHEGSCPLRLPAQGHPAPIELLRSRMDTLLHKHSQQCGGQACCRLPLPAESSLGLLLFCCPACGCAVGVV
jgi:hypothetical protein